MTWNNYARLFNKTKTRQKLQLTTHSHLLCSPWKRRSTWGQKPFLYSSSCCKLSLHIQQSLSLNPVASFSSKAKNQSEGTQIVKNLKSLNNFSYSRPQELASNCQKPANAQLLIRWNPSFATLSSTKNQTNNSVLKNRKRTDGSCILFCGGSTWQEQENFKTLVNWNEKNKGFMITCRHVVCRGSNFWMLHKFSRTNSPVNSLGPGSALE